MYKHLILSIIAPVTYNLSQCKFLSDTSMSSPSHAPFMQISTYKIKTSISSPSYDLVSQVSKIIINYIAGQALSQAMINLMVY